MSIERYPRSARRYHTAIYLVVLVLLATGWWLLAGREGQPSPLAAITGISDAVLHTWFGWGFVVVALIPLPFALRGVVAFLRESVRRDAGDLAWLRRLPAAAFTGRFRRHEGHFDPGQRIANIAIVVLLAALLVSGAAMTMLSAGPLFAAMVFIHQVSTYLFTIVIVGHILIAIGILPGYRGVWRSMHLSGRVPLAVARRLWPGWTERRERATAAETPAGETAAGESRPNAAPGGPARPSERLARGPR